MTATRHHSSLACGFSSVVRLSLGLSMLLATNVATAGIEGISGDGELIDPPLSVDAGDLESDSAIRVFVEKAGFVLPVDVSVDILGLGRADMDNRNTPPTPGQIPAGTKVDVFFIHHDSVNLNLNSLVTSISTDGEILGLIHSDDLLDATDALLGAAGTLYPTGRELRGMVVDPTEGDSEFVEIDNTPNGPRLVTLLSTVENVLDQVRVLTVSTVPEPNSCLLLLLGAMGSCMLTRTQHRDGCH